MNDPIHLAQTHCLMAWKLQQTPCVTTSHLAWLRFSKLPTKDLNRSAPRSLEDAFTIIRKYR